MSFGPSSNVYTSSALETVSLVSGSTVLTRGGSLLGFLADNFSSSAGWVQVFDGHAAPSNAAVPIASFRVGATSQISVGLTAVVGISVNNGIVLALSSTGPTYTAVSTELFVTAFWQGI